MPTHTCTVGLVLWELKEISEGAAVVFNCVLEYCTNLTVRKEHKASILVPAIFTQLRYFGFLLMFSRLFYSKYSSGHTYNFLLSSIKSCQHDIPYRLITIKR